MEKVALPSGHDGDAVRRGYECAVHGCTFVVVARYTSESHVFKWEASLAFSRVDAWVSTKSSHSDQSCPCGCIGYCRKAVIGGRSWPVYSNPFVAGQALL